MQRLFDWNLILHSRYLLDFWTSNEKPSRKHVRHKFINIEIFQLTPSDQNELNNWKVPKGKILPYWASIQNIYCLPSCSLIFHISMSGRRIKTLSENQMKIDDKHCLKSIWKVLYSEFFWSIFSHIRTEYGKIRTRKTPNTNTFHIVKSSETYEAEVWPKMTLNTVLKICA